MLLFAHDLWNSLLAVIRESLGRVLQKTRLRARLGRRHRRRKVNKPMRVDSKPAHHLKRSRRVLLRNRDVSEQARLYDALADHVGEFEQVFVVAGPRGGGRLVPFRQEGLRRLVIRARGRHRYQLALWVAQGRQASTEDAA